MWALKYLFDFRTLYYHCNINQYCYILLTCIAKLVCFNVPQTVSCSHRRPAYCMAMVYYFELSHSEEQQQFWCCSDFHVRDILAILLIQIFSAHESCLCRFGVTCSGFQTYATTSVMEGPGIQFVMQTNFEIQHLKIIQWHFFPATISWLVWIMHCQQYSVGLFLCVKVVPIKHCCSGMPEMDMSSTPG